MFFQYKTSHYKLYKLCLKNNIPIIRKKTAKFISNFILNSNYEIMLEIGTAYGFSANLFSKINSIKEIDTIEINKLNYDQALCFVKSSKINFLNLDIFEFHNNKKYDVIFIDGPKSNQEIILKNCLSKLNKNGVIFIDNLYLNKFKNKTINKISKNKLKLINKLEKFNSFLKTSNDFIFKEISIDDGLGIVCNKNDEEWFNKKIK